MLFGPRNRLRARTRIARLRNTRSTVTDADAPREVPARQLFAAALAEDSESDERWRIVTELQRRGDREPFDIAIELTGSANAEERELGVAVLGQLGFRAEEADRPYREPTIDVLIDLLNDETSPEVLKSATTALGHLRAKRAIPTVTAFSRHPDPDVRMGVVNGLSSQEDELAIATLIELSADEVDDIRDWATFAIGTLHETDTPEIREALACRLGDRHDDAAAEGVAGLAHRGDPRAVEPLLALLETNEGPLVDNALAGIAAHITDERLRPHVEALWAQKGPSRGEEPLAQAAKRYGLSDA